jgi:hypothetical protein
MSNNRSKQSKTQDEPFRPQRMLQWAACHPGVVLVSSLAVGTVLACRRAADQQASADRRVETEADIIDGDAPLFI